MFDPPSLLFHTWDDNRGMLPRTPLDHDVIVNTLRKGWRCDCTAFSILQSRDQAALRTPRRHKPGPHLEIRIT